MNPEESKDLIKTLESIGISEELDYSLIDNIEVAGIDFKDYPDFCDAYIESADYDGKPMTEEQLDILNEDGDFVYEQVEKTIY